MWEKLFSLDGNYAREKVDDCLAKTGLHRLMYRREPRKIFGIGLNKTGTTSLRACFRAFGLSHMGCRRDLLKAYRDQRLSDIFRTTDKYSSFQDWPYPLMYRELNERYGSRSLFILTKRASPEIWLDSLKSHCLNAHPVRNNQILAYGRSYPHGYEEDFISLYETHNQAVESYFKAQGASDRLLTVCWETGDGWPELCEFLQFPPVDRPFPYANKRKAPNPRRVASNQALIDRQINLKCP